MRWPSRTPAGIFTLRRRVVPSGRRSSSVRSVPLYASRERDLDVLFDVGADRGAAAAGSGTTEERPRVEVRGTFTEQRAEEIREAARFAVERVLAGLTGVDPLESAGLLLRRPVLETLPVRTDRVVALALLGIERTSLASLISLKRFSASGFLLTSGWCWRASLR